MTGLWQWQDDDAKRLRREGRDKLADYWDDGDYSAESLERAMLLARAMDEPVWELFFAHWFVQQSLYRELAPIERIQPIAERLTALAADPRCATCPQRFCARESSLNVLQAVDARGSALMVAAVAQGMLKEELGELECRNCFVMLQAGALTELGRLDEAEVTINGLLASCGDDNLVFLAHLFRAAVWRRRGENEAMESELETCRQMLKNGAPVNADNEWYLLELEVALKVLLNDPEGAEHLVENSDPQPPEGCLEHVRIGIELARAWAKSGGWERSLAHAERVAQPAVLRGLTRLAAEASLLAAEASRELADDDRLHHHAATGSALAQQLGTRDLDERVRAIGCE